jgi:hypothetical protein
MRIPHVLINNLGKFDSCPFVNGLGVSRTIALGVWLTDEHVESK